ncbi:MAG: response regulator transcription factor [Patescibacteria group bacterium]|jgi:DNA-binding response OmpR family regulator
MKILVVEDEHKIANSIKKGLLQEAYVVDVAYDGQAGFDLAVGQDYDVIVLDLMLPEISGLEICRRLRQEEKVQTPILILTAKGELDDRVAGLNAGADDYLVKPFAFAELLARLRALSRRPKNRLGQILEAGDLTLDTNKFLVKRAGKEIKLSKKEYTLLKYLLAQKGQIVSKQQIIDHVWDYEADILPNTVEVYIGYLRKKIDKPFKKKLIKTVRGFGYQIRQAKNN